tara:strand:+ start:109 stop:288 length:180 start_codon:yes stop_codon:yes gene_type:complete
MFVLFNRGMPHNLKTNNKMKNEPTPNTFTIAAKVNLSDVAIIAFSIGMVALCVYGIFSI